MKHYKSVSAVRRVPLCGRDAWTAGTGNPARMRGPKLVSSTGNGVKAAPICSDRGLRFREALRTLLRFSNG